MPDPCLVSSPRVQLDLVPQGGVDALTADVILSAKAEQGLTLESDGLWSPRGPIIVGSLPASPVDGMERYVTAGDSLWHVTRYSGVWYVVGGGALVSIDAGGDAGATWGADAAWHLFAGGPTITVPYAGTYVVEWGAHLNPPAVGETARVGLSVNSGTPATDRWAAYGGPSGSGVAGSGIATVSRIWALTLAANDVLKLTGLATGSSGSGVATHRWMKLQARTLA